jgi:Mycotoxin biosynthesis protein UstYa
MDTNSSDPLLQDKESSLDGLINISSEELLLDHYRSPHVKERRSRSNIAIYIGIVWLTFNAVWSAYLASYLGDTAHGAGPDLIQSPARSAVGYEKIVTNSTVYNTNQFRGKPSPEVTEAWHSAYTRWARIVVSGDDLKAIDRESIPLADGSGYLATLDVFHQLHCL